MPVKQELFSFLHNYSFVHSTIVHFQLRNLLWATTSHDVYAVHNNCIMRNHVVTQHSRLVLDLTGAERGTQNAGQVHVSTMCAAHGLIAAGAHSAAQNYFLGMLAHIYANMLVALGSALQSWLAMF